MNINSTGKHLESDSAAKTLIDILQKNESSLGLQNAELYYDFPLYKDLDGDVVIS